MYLFVFPQNHKISREGDSLHPGFFFFFFFFKSIGSINEHLANTNIAFGDTESFETSAFGDFVHIFPH